METRTIVVTEVNLGKGVISGRDQFGHQILVSVTYGDGLTIIPAKDDVWQVVKKGTFWFLDKRAENKNTVTKQEQMAAGDGRLEVQGDLHINANQIHLNGEPFDPNAGYNVTLNGNLVGASRTVNFKTTEGGVQFFSIYDTDRDAIDIFAHSPRPERIYHINTAGYGGVEFQNGWVNYDNLYQTACFSRDPWNWVSLQGLIKDGSSTIFTLPQGYRPSKHHIFVQVAGPGIARVDVRSDGAVLVAGYMSSGSNAYVSLAGIRFPTSAVVDNVPAFVSHVSNTGKEVRITGA